MERGYWVRALLAFIVGASVWVGLVRAQEPPGPIQPVPTVPYAAQQPQPPSVPVPATPPPFIVEFHPQFQGPVWVPPDLLVDQGLVPQRRPLCCYATINSLGCGSWKADCTFAFGSCRKFYGEPCYPKPGRNPAAGGFYGSGAPAPACNCP